jgi:hypothetical protein
MLVLACYITQKLGNAIREIVMTKFINRIQQRIE